MKEVGCSLSSMKRLSSKPSVPAQETVLTGRAWLWKTTTKPPFTRVWTLHISSEVLHFPDAYCLFAILLGQTAGLVTLSPFLVLHYHTTACLTNLAALLTTTSGLQTVQPARFNSLFHVFTVVYIHNTVWFGALSHPVDG